MSPEELALRSTLLAWQQADWVWLWGGLMIVVCLALLVAVTWLLVTPNWRNEWPPPDPEGEIVDERHRRGEISEDDIHGRQTALR